MKTLNWKLTNWGGRSFVFSIGKEIIGQMNFYSSWKFNALYTDRYAKIVFKQQGFWNGKIVVSIDEKIAGVIEGGFFGNPTLKLVTGERFELSSNFWGRAVYWKNDKDEKVIKYQQATLSSMGKGVIMVKDSMENEYERILISSGFFMRQLIIKRLTLIIVILIPIYMVVKR